MKFKFSSMPIHVAVAMLLGLTYCAKKADDTPKPVTVASVSSNSEKAGSLSIAKFVSTSIKDQTLDAFLKSEDYANYNAEKLGKLDVEHAYLATFKETESTQALSIPIVDQSSLSKDGKVLTRRLIAYYDLDTKTFFTIVHELDGTGQYDKEGTVLFTGTEKSYTPEGYLAGGKDIKENLEVAIIKGDLPDAVVFRKYGSMQQCYNGEHAACQRVWYCQSTCTVFTAECEVVIIGYCIYDQTH